MNTAKYIFTIIILATFFLPIAFVDAEKEIAVVIKVKGSAAIKSGDKNWESLKNGRRLHSDDLVKTGKDALVAIVFTDDKSMLKIRSNSQFQLKGERTEKGVAKKLLMMMGEVWSKITPKGAGYEMVTPSGVAAVRGTEFYSIVDALKTTIIGITGSVEIRTSAGSALVTGKKTGTMEKGKTPAVVETKGFEAWADTDDVSQSLDIEFEDENGVKKKLKIRYQE